MRYLPLSLLCTLFLTVSAAEDQPIWQGHDLVLHQTRPEAKAMLIIPAG